MIDLTPIAIALVIVGVPWALSAIYRAWQDYKQLPNSLAYVLETTAAEAVRLVDDLKATGNFDDVENKAEAYLQYAAEWASQKLAAEGYSVDFGKVVDACRIAYQAWKARKG